MAHVLIQLTRDALLSDFGLEVRSALLPIKRVPYLEIASVVIRETWRGATLIIRGKEDASPFHIATSKETATRARSIILQQIREYQQIVNQTAAYPELEPYRRFAFTLLKCCYAQTALRNDIVDALDIFGIFRSKGQEGRQEDKVTEPDMVDEIKKVLARIASREPWSPEEITTHIIGLKQLQVTAFSKEPWMAHKQEPFQLLPSALEALRSFERQMRGFSLDELSTEIPDVVLNAADFRDIEARMEALINKYAPYPHAVKAIRDSMAFELEILEQVARAALENIEKKCPRCAERPKAEARICRYCGYRFEGETADQVLAEARLKAERIAIAAAREVTGVGPKAKTVHEEAALKASTMLSEALRKAQAETI